MSQLMKCWCAIIAIVAGTVCGRVALGADDESDPPVLKATVVEDIAGHKHALTGSTAPKLTVLVFLGTECPVSNGYAPTLKRLSAAHRAKSVSFIGVHCDPDVTVQVAKDHAAEYQLPFPLVLDHQQRLAGICSVEVVPTAVVVDSAGWILYRGRIDNRYVSNGVRRPQATVFDLQAAIDASLAGKQPQPAVTEPFGCPLPPPRQQ